jgi:hypothetical protein
MNKKFSLTRNEKKQAGITLFQIKAEVSFGNVEKGELGGWVEKEENLSHDGDAWVYGNALVYGNAWVHGDAQVSGDAWVYGNARVHGDARVYGKLKIIAGSFFGIRRKGEEIKYIQIDDDVELIYKGEARFGEEEKETIKIGEVEYDKADVEERLKGIKPVN